MSAMIAPIQTDQNNPGVPQTKPSSPVVIPKYLWRIFQFIGLLPVSYRRPTEPCLNPHNNCFLVLSSLLLLCLILAYSVIRIGDYVALYLDQLKDLEFFTLISCICFISSQLQVPWIFMLMYIKAKYLPNLLCKLHKPLLWYDNNKARRPLWSVIAALLALLWVIVTFIAPVFHLGQVIRQNIIYEWYNDLNDTWSTPETKFFNLIAAPSWLWLAVEIIHKGVILGVTNGSQMLTFLVVLAIGKGFRDQCRLLKNNTVNDRKPGLETWVFCRRNTAALLDIVYKTNDIFGWTNLVVCMQDLLNLIHYVALMLQEMIREQTQDEDTFEDQRFEKKIIEIQNVDPLIMSVVNLVLRFAVCSYCNEQGQKLGFLAQQCTLQSDDVKIQMNARRSSPRCPAMGVRRFLPVDLHRLQRNIWLRW
ncbi:uncharacterized protein LOC129592132 [Paramacrobiotus metropolitanus]|uniref:uncharacterized protein LOC129592132 n=1 Tax=Paramacrobiotus metropolitanus TaxID=2943436 RepID=UPI002445ECCB|nr:uncharacterized protein LOC129592132 [Paramacrobiotus metropolitanus]